MNWAQLFGLGKSGGGGGGASASSSVSFGAPGAPNLTVILLGAAGLIAVLVVAVLLIRE